MAELDFDPGRGGSHLRYLRTLVAAGAIGFVTATNYRRTMQILGPSDVLSGVFFIMCAIGLGTSQIVARAAAVLETSAWAYCIGTVLIVASHNASFVSDSLIGSLDFLKLNLSLELIACTVAISFGSAVPSFGLGLTAFVRGSPNLIKMSLCGATLICCACAYKIGDRVIAAFGVEAGFAAALAIVVARQVVECILKPSAQHLMALALSGLSICCLHPSLGDRFSYGIRPLRDGERIITFSSGAQHDVRVVDRDSVRVLQIDGVDVGDSEAGSNGELALSALARILRPKIETAFVIGLGTGAACGAILLEPKSRVVCAVAERRTVDVQSLFVDKNHSPTKSERFSVANDSATHILAKNAPRLDAILVNCGNRYSTEGQLLWNQEFYLLSSTALGERGIFLARLPLPQLGRLELGWIARSVIRYFGNCALARLPGGQGVLIASKAVLISSTNELTEVQGLVDDGVLMKQDLIDSFGMIDVRSILFSSLLFDTTGFEHLAAWNGARTAVGKSERSLSAVWSNWRRSDRPEMESKHLLLDLCSAEWLTRSFDRCGCQSGHLVLLDSWIQALSANGNLSAALELIEWGLKRDGKEPNIQTEKLILSGEENRLSLESEIENIEHRSVSAALRVTDDLVRKHRSNEALKILRGLSDRHPTFPSIWLRLGNTYFASGETANALMCLRTAEKLDGGSDQIAERVKEVEISAGFKF